jgi:chromosomal replication initiator protein
MEDCKIAAALAAQLAARIGPQRFALWFGPQTKLQVGPRGLTVRVANAFMRDCLHKTFANEIRECWKSVGGDDSPIEYEVDETGKCPERKELHSGTQSKPSDRATCKGNFASLDSPPKNPADLRPDFTLDGFVVGSGNEYAFQAARLTASGRQQASPLLFWGPTGVGKTHLLRAIQREYRRQHPRNSSIYLTAEQFTTSFIEAIRGSGLPSFRQKCRGAQLLLIDDVQFFVGKQRTLEELRYTIDTLLADGRQLVLASDRNVASLRALGQEVSSRLASGLACEIDLPDYATRLGIVQRLVAQIGLAIDEDVAAMIATHIHAGARELRGALHRLHTMSMAYGEPVSRDLAERALGEIARHCNRPVKLADVEKAVCEVFGIEPADLRSDRKSRAANEPRMLAMWLARKYTRAAWSEIGHFFGRRSHSTVISAHRRVEHLIGSRGCVGLDNCACSVEEAIRKLEAALRTA